MTNEEAIKFLSQIKNALLANNSWLPSTDNPIKESFGMAINALTAQPVAKDINVPINDCISRQAAIDHLKKRLYETALNNNTEHPYYEEIADNRVDIWLNELPSAQPEKRTEEHTETHGVCLDAIDRQAAIEALDKRFDSIPMEQTTEILLLRKDLRELPPAQPEPCEDAVSRQDAIRIVDGIDTWQAGWRGDAIESMKALPSAQPDLVRCKDCEYGEQDEVGRWFCRSLGCQIGNEDGSGYCADAERRTDG